MKIKHLIVLIIVFAIIMAFAAGCVSDPSEPELTGISIKDGTAPASLLQLVDADFSAVVVIASFSDGSTKEITAADLTFSEVSTDELGEVEITVTYKGKTTTFTAEVVQATAVINSIAVKAGTFANEIAQHSTPNFTTITVVLTYANLIKAEIPGTNENLTIGTIDTSTFGIKTVNVSYEDEHNTTPLTTAFNVNVYEVSTLNGYYIDKYEMPDFINTYNSNISLSTSGENAYLDKTAPYYVGSVNKFKFMPKVTVVKGTDSKVLTEYKSDYEVARWDGAVWVTLTGDDLDDYVEIFPLESAFQFTALANGGKFKLTFIARDVDIYEDEYGKDEFNPLNFVVSVIDAYNVYNAAGLSVFDNTNKDGAWTSYKEANGIDVNLNVNGLVLHRNIAVTVNDVPADFFYTSANPTFYIEAGSMKKWTYMYNRKGDLGQTFNFIGNYFSIDFSAMPLGTERDGEAKPPINNSQIFNFLDNSDPSDDAEGLEFRVNWATNNVKNITLIGNATKAPGENEMKRMGGLIMLKTNAHMTNVYNVIMRRSFTDIYVLYEDSNFIFEKSQAYDSYSNSMLFWENVAADTDPNATGKTMLIKNSIIKRSGGPALILNDYDTGSSGGSFTNNAYIEIETSIVESYVTGEEGWFVANSASAAMGQIKGLDLAFNAYGKSYVKDGTQVNFMVLMMPGDALTDTYPIKCWVKIDGKIVSSFADLQVAGYMGALKGSTAPIFQSSEGGVCSFSNSPSLMLFEFTPGMTEIGSPDHAVFQGDYITIYPEMGTYLGALFTYQ